MPNVWMVRAGEGSLLAKEFEQQGCVAFGADVVGDLTNYTTLEVMRSVIETAYPHFTPQGRVVAAAQTYKFRNALQPGDRVITYDGTTRECLLGTLVGGYEYRPGTVSRYDNIRRVEWQGRVKRDVLAERSRNTLGSVLSIFDPGADVLADVEDALRTGRTVSPTPARKSRGKEGFPTLFSEFVSDYLETPTGANHLERHAETARTGRANFERVIAAERDGKDITDLVLRTLLPHTSSKRHEADGSWIHIAPAINADIRSWYEGSGIAEPEEWPAKARGILAFVKRMTEAPEVAGATCEAFGASADSKGMQSGMLSPILNAVRPDALSIANSKVVSTLAALTGKKHSTKIADYPVVNAAVWAMISANETLLGGQAEAASPATLFDTFCHWFIAVRGDESPAMVEGEEETAEEESEPSEGLDRASAGEARRIAEWLCPDPAPRASALQFLARSIAYSNQASGTAWSVTLKRRLIRLNVAGILVVDLRRDGVYVVADESAIGVDASLTLKKFDQDAGFRYVPDIEGFLIPYSALEPALTLITPAHESAIRRLTEKSNRAPFGRAHSSGVLDYLRSIGHEVPDPQFVSKSSVGDEPQRRVPKTEDPPVTRAWPINPLFPLEDVAAETHLSTVTVEGWAQAVNRKGQAILYGPPGTGKTFCAERLARHLVGGGDGIIELVQFHPAFAYEDFIQGLRPTVGRAGAVEFTMVPGRFKQFCTVAAERSGPCVLIIDEINRANLAEVFGELMYLLEYRDKKIPLSGGGVLRIPPNARIIGTMNTADRSIALVDHALRRRFSFIKLAPEFSALERFHARNNRDVTGLVSVLRRLNNAINNPHYYIGISYFMRDSLHADLRAIWSGEIEPYLEEYFFDNEAAVNDFRWEKIREEAEV